MDKSRSGLIKNIENRYDPTNSTACELVIHSLNKRGIENPAHKTSITASILRCVFPDGIEIYATVAVSNAPGNDLDALEDTRYNPLANYKPKC